MGEVPGQWGVYRSACPGAGFYPRGGQEEQEGGGKESEAHIIYSREGHVWGADHQGDKSVAKSADHNWYYYKEDYYKRVCCDDYIIDLVVSKEGSGLA